MHTRTRNTMERHTGRATTADGLMIRRSRAEDAPAIERLAQLDSQRVPSGDFLLAEVGGELVAAVSVTGDRAIADPFRRTDHIVELLRVSLAPPNGRRSSGRSWSRVPRVRPLASLVRS